MNILFYLHQYPATGGIETVTTSLAGWFAASGHKVTILSHVHKESGAGMFDSGDSIVIEHVPDRERLVSAENRAFLSRMIAERRPDVMIFQDSYARIERNLDGLWSRLPIVVCEHNSPLAPVRRAQRSGFIPKMAAQLALSAYRQWRWSRDDVRRRRYLYGNCARYVLLSERFFGEFRALARLEDWRKLAAVPNPVSPMMLRQTPDSRQDKENVILCAASLNGLKGHDYLLSAWESLAGRLPNWTLELAGDGPERAKLEAIVCARGLPRVAFLGCVSDMRPLYARAKILAHTSRRDGWPCVLHEAMSQGAVPVVFNSFSSIYDVVDPGENAVVVPSFDVDRFADVIGALALDDGRLAMMSQNCRERARRCRIDKIGGIWDGLLAEVVGEFAKARA